MPNNRFQPTASLREAAAEPGRWNVGREKKMGANWLLLSLKKEV